MKQTTFASAAYDHKKVTTKREKFLQSIDKLAPWQRVLGLIQPHYPKKGNGPDHRLICRPCYAFIVYSNGTTYQTQA